MTTVAVVGTGPVGLATADQLSRAGYRVLLVSPVANPITGGTPAKGTYHAAAAFWTPFSSGAHAKVEKVLSSETLRFYEQFKEKNPATGVIWRTVEQIWQEGTRPDVPEWSTHPQIKFTTSPADLKYQQSAGSPFRWRREFSYQAPVIHVDKFRQWYLDQLVKQQVEVNLSWNYPLTRNAAPDQSAEGDAAWRRLLLEHDASAVVICTGAATSYFKLFNDAVLMPRTIAFKKGVVARIEAHPADDESVLMYEGGSFERDTLYLVPHSDVYVLGGTVHAVGADYHAADWTETEEEKQGILDRARRYLPEKSKEKLGQAGLWAAGDNEGVTWRVGVRPVLANHGPFYDALPEMSEQLSALTGRSIRAFGHFGHGGSGFTLCQDTARRVVEKVKKALPSTAAQ